MRLSFVLHEPDEDEEEDADEIEALADELLDEGSEGPADAEPGSAELSVEVTGETGLAAAAATAPAPPAIWLLTLHLQGLDGAGELLDAAALWQGAGKSAILGRSVAKRQSALLTELSRAAEVFPPAQSLLAHPAPSRLALSTADAYAFIRHWGPILRDRGFGVTLPEWASHPDEELGLRLVLSPMQEMDDLFDPANPATANGPRRRAGGMGEAIEFSTASSGSRA